MVQKHIWGNICWYLFHASAFKLKEDYQYLVPELFNLIVSICLNLPCPSCRDEAKKTIARTNRKKLKTKNDLILCLFHYHNYLNKKLKKPIYTLKEHDKLYHRANLPKILKKWNQIMSIESHNQQDMLLSVSKKNLRNKVLTFFRRNKQAFIY